MKNHIWVVEALYGTRWGIMGCHLTREDARFQVKTLVHAKATRIVKYYREVK